MCINSRYIWNPYSRSSVLVKCGKCDACLQEKAQQRTRRIRNNIRQGEIVLFVTLTYANDYIPYITKTDLLSDSPFINVYRDNDIRMVYSKQKGLSYRKITKKSIVYDSFIAPECRCTSDVHSLSHLHGGCSDKVGVCLYSDFQKFIKKLRITLKRKYNYGNSFKYFVVSEYGPSTQRPHFHALLFIPSSIEKIIRSEIPACWSYADRSRTERYIEIARDAANYVSSYVNGNGDLPDCLADAFPSAHHFSQDFGTGLNCFQLPEIIKAFNEGDMYYRIGTQFNGTSSVFDVPIPSYVINRFFPKFKGFGRLSSSSLFNIARKPEDLRNELSKIDNPLYSFTPREERALYVRLINCRNRFINLTGMNEYDFAYFYSNIWNYFSSQHLKDLHKDVQSIYDYVDFYDNTNDLIHDVVQAPTLREISKDLLCSNPNERRLVRKNHDDMVTLFHKRKKIRKVTNLIMSINGHDV